MTTPKTLAAEVAAGGGAEEAVALALGWRKFTYEQEYRPEGCDRIEHISTHTVPWWCGPNGERREYLPPRFLTSIDACAAECERQSVDWMKYMNGHGNLVIAVRTNDLPKQHYGEALTDGTVAGDARALCSALLLAVAAKEAGQ